MNTFSTWARSSGVHPQLVEAPGARRAGGGPSNVSATARGCSWISLLMKSG